jgi:hypothetical protein
MRFNFGVTISIESTGMTLLLYPTRSGSRRPVWTVLFFIVGPSLRSSAWLTSLSNQSLIPHRRFIRTRQKLHIEVLASQKISNDDTWEVGDVYRDLALLDQAIALENADQDLQHMERIETLDHFAKQRRLIRPDIRRYAVAPFLLSLSLLLLFQSTRVGRIRTSIAILSNMHAWLVLVMGPMCLLLLKKTRKPSSSESNIPSGLVGLDPAYYRFLSDWEDPDQTTKDYVLCMLEQWTSVVAGLALFRQLLPTSCILPCRLMIRLGTLASLHQYQKLWFQLHRTQQPRPEAGSVWALKTLSQLQATPWLVAADLALYFSSWSASLWIVFGYGVAGCIVVLLESCPGLIYRTGQHRKYISRVLVALIFGLYIRTRYDSILGILAWFQNFATADYMLRPMTLQVLFAVIPWRYLGVLLAMAGSLTMPLCHLYAIQRLFCVMYTHDLSLALDRETATEQAKNDPSRMQWRYKLKWREPQRLHVTWKEWCRRFWYWLFFAGSVQDKLWNEMRRGRKEQAKRSDQTIWQRLAKETMENPDEPKPDRTQWKRNAIKFLEDKHEKDYENETFEVRLEYRNVFLFICV